MLTLALSTDGFDQERPRTTGPRRVNNMTSCDNEFNSLFRIVLQRDFEQEASTTFGLLCRPRIPEKHDAFLNNRSVNGQGGCTQERGTGQQDEESQSSHVVI